MHNEVCYRHMTYSASLAWLPCETRWMLYYMYYVNCIGGWILLPIILRLGKMSGLYLTWWTWRALIKWGRWVQLHSVSKEMQFFWSCISFEEECLPMNKGLYIIVTMLLVMQISHDPGSYDPDPGLQGKSTKKSCISIFKLGPGHFLPGGNYMN